MIGHDRGAHVAMRTALDHPDRVTHLGVLDGIPIGEALARFAARWWHWFFLGQTTRPAEHIINADPLAWYGGDPRRMGAEAYEDFRAAVTDPDIWAAWAPDLRTVAVDSGHHLAEDAPGPLAAAILDLLGSPAGPPAPPGDGRTSTG